HRFFEGEQDRPFLQIPDTYVPLAGPGDQRLIIWPEQGRRHPLGLRIGQFLYLAPALRFENVDLLDIADGKQRTIAREGDVLETPTGRLGRRYENREPFRSAKVPERDGAFLADDGQNVAVRR